MTTTAPNEDTSTLISEFPVELLHIVFTFLTQPPTSDPAHFDNFVYSPYLAITAVCRRWRSVAIAYGQLWTIIQLPHNNMSWVAELIRRSKGNSLWITLRSRAHRLSQAQLDTLALALERFDMIREIDLKLNNRLSDSVTPLLSQPAPLLRRLLINRTVFSDGSRGTLLFNKLAPELEELYLAECFWFWEKQVSFIRSIPKLTRLTLMNVHRCISLRQFVDVFRFLPLLKDLEIQGSIPETTPTELEASSSIPIVRLDSLVSLQIRASIGSCVSFLERISFSPETDVNIEAWCISGDHQAALLPFCRRFGKDEDGRQIGYIQDLTILAGQDIRGFVIRSVMQLEGRDRTGRGLTLRSSYDPTSSAWYPALPTLLHDLIDSLPTQHLRRLTTTYLPFTETQWTDVLRRLESMEMIMFSGIYGTVRQTEFIDALSKWDWSLKLKAVTLYNVPSRGDFDTLCLYFKGRRERGLPLRSLWFVVPPKGEELEWCASWYPALGLEPPASWMDLM